MAEEGERTRSNEAIEEDVGRLKEWLCKQPHLPQDVEQELLFAFVQSTKSLEIAKKKLDNYYTARNLIPKLYDFNNRDATTKRFMELSQAMEMFFLPKTTPEGYRVLMVRMNIDAYDLFDHPHETARILMIVELGIKSWPDAPGYYFVYDFKGVPANVTTKISASTMAVGIPCFQDGYPLRLKGVFISNAPSIADFLFNNIFKPVLKEKMFKRIKISSDDISTYHDFLPQEILPSNFGGKEKTSAELNEDWMNLLVENRSWFEHTSQQMADEEKRPPDSLSSYGVDGTFRKLAVD